MKEENTQQTQLPSGDQPSAQPAGSAGSPAPEKPRKRHLIRCAWVRIPLKALLGLLIFILLIPVLIYIPPVQTLLKDSACSIVAKQTGMKIDVDRFRLRFPLDVALEGVTIVENTGDTMVRAKALVADVKLLPLLHLDVRLNRLRLEQGAYRMVSPDSSMIMNIRAGLLEADGKSSFDIKQMDLNLNRALLRDGDISLYMNVWKQEQKPRDTTATPFKVRAADLRLENVRFAMSMLPTIDTLTLLTDRLILKKGLVDLSTNDITADLLQIDGGSFAYLAPTKEFVDTHPAPVDTVNTEPAPSTTVRAKKVKVSNFNALYATAGVTPAPGFDATYIQATGIDLELNDFYNQASTLRLPIQSMRATERCGLQVTSGSGTVGVDETGITLTDMALTTPFSAISATADIPYALMEMKPDAAMSVTADANVAMTDVLCFMPSLRSMLNGISPQSMLSLNVDASGSLSSINIPRLDVALSNVLRLKASGYADNALDFKRMKGAVKLDGELTNPKVVENLTNIGGVNIPRLKISGTASVDRQAYGADIALTTSEGDLAAKGKIALTAETYNVDLDIKGLNAEGIVPGVGLGPLTATLHAAGAGFNPSKPTMTTDVDLHVAECEYSGHTYNDVTLVASLHDGDIKLNLDSGDPLADLHIDGTGRVDGDLYSFNVTGDLNHVNLKALGITPDENQGHARLHINGTANPTSWLYDANLHVEDFYWMLGENEYTIPEPTDVDLLADADTTTAHIHAPATELSFTSREGLQDVVNKFTEASQELTLQLDRKQLAIDVLQPMLPDFDLDVNASGRGLLNTFLYPNEMSVDTLSVCLTNDSTLQGRIGVEDLRKGTLRLDTITLGLNQRSSMLDYVLHLGNRPGTLDEFADVKAAGYIGGNRASMYLTQHNISGDMGYRIGLTAAMQDSTVSVHFTPLKATIAYMPWTFNTDNHIDYTFGGAIDANLKASSKESSILVQTEPAADGDIKLHLNLDNIHLEDFLSLSVMAPPVKATINSDLSVIYRGNRISGEGTLDVSDFYYDRQRIGDLNFLFDAGLDFNGNTEANLSLLVNNKKALTAHGRLIEKPEEGESPTSFGVTLTQFPLDLANPFLGPSLGSLGGYLNGEMAMTGKFSKPVLNGYIAFEDATAYLSMAAATLKFDDQKVTVADNVVKFNSFEIFGANDNPLVISGDVDATDLYDMRFDLKAQASEMQLINTPAKSRADLTGKLFVNLDATVRGPLKRFDINARLNVLKNTNVTYTLASASSDISQVTQGEVVKFVQFNDSTQVERADSIAPTMAMRINAAVSIASGTQVTVNLNPGGSNKVVLTPSGNLTYSQNYMGDMRLNGQLFTGEGYARYNVPVLGEKKFVFNPQSYVTWNGDILNPTLSLNATDQVRANVQSSGGNSRTVNFDVSLNVSNTLSSPKILFDLSTPDDLSVQNELQSMSADQRSTQAMNLLLYGQYVGPGSKSSTAFSGNNALYGFLESQINSWAANNIKGVDLSFGINENQQTTDGQTNTSTSYSYQVSKSLFDNRFKIVVGGNYTTNASADENFAQNLISDISFEYMIRQTNSTSIYAKLFRHTGFESILEGNVTETGVGLVMRRRLNTLRNLLRFRFGKRKSTATQSDAAPADSVAAAPADSIAATAASAGSTPSSTPSPATDAAQTPGAKTSNTQERRTNP